MIRWHGSLLLDKIDDKTFLQLQDCLFTCFVGAIHLERGRIATFHLIQKTLGQKQLL